MSMAVKGRKVSPTGDCPEEALQYRRPMQVREIMVFPDMRGRPSMAVCPRCGITIEREYVAYCDHCGQCLGWRDFKTAVIVFPRAGRNL